MKKILFLAFIMIIMKANAQITLEHTYDNASVISACTGSINQLMIIKFELSGEHYVKINRCDRVISVYNMNHSLEKNISLANLFLHNGNIEDILYVSDNLFDNDNGIEFMYLVDSIDYYVTTIYDEDGTVLFYAKRGGAFVKPNYQQQQYPIYNTESGTKMILSYDDGTAKVFSLPGKLTTSVINSTNGILNESNLLSIPFPNPSSNETRIQYQLPNGVNQGDIIFYDVAGRQIKRFTVDRSFDYLSISTADIPAGTYYYRLETNSLNTEAKKLVVIK